jgi:ABC-2 type transport system permease protein
MSWSVVAKKDFKDAVRSRLFWALSALFLLFVGLLAAAYVGVDVLSDGDQTTLGLVFFIASSLGLFVSLTAIVIGYKAIAGERESGSIKILLALPHTRRDVVLGKIIGRGAVLAIPVVVALGLGTLGGMVALGDFELLGPVAYLVVGLLFVLAYVAIVVGFSATTGSTGRAASLTVGFFVIFELFWDAVVFGLAFVQAGFELPPISEFPAWVFPVSQVPPSSAFGTALVAVIPDAPATSFGAGPGAEQLDAFYATPWFAFVILLFWIVVPPVIGYWRFEHADL